MKELYIKIEGRVQRVGFRRWVKSKALEIGNVSGFVRNEYDGSVEVLMRGGENEVNLMLQACYDGPLLARVDKISFLLKTKMNDLPPIIDGSFMVI